MFSEKKYKLVPPDGGWGYLAALGVVICNIATMGFSPLFTILYKELTINLKMGTQHITTITALCSFCVATSAYVSSALLRVLSKRQIVLIGAIFFNLGGFGVIFAHTQLFFVFNLIVQCIGSGFLINLSYVIINDYFLEKKVLFMSLTAFAPSVANMLAPHFIRWLNEEVGYKGTLMILSGFYMQVFVSAFLMQPVEWHMKKVEILNEVTEKPLIITSSKELSRSLKSEDSHTLTISIETKLKKSSSSASCIDPVKETEDGKASDDVLLGTKEKTCIQKVVHALNLTVFRNFFIVNTCLGIAFCIFSDSNFLTVLPPMLRSQGWSEHTIATAVSLFGLGDISFRLIIIVFSKFFARVGVRPLFKIGLVFGIISRLAMLWSDNVTVMTAFITMAGLSHCTITSLPPLVLSEIVTPEEFPAAAGVMMLVNGAIFLVFGPAVGAVRDLTKSYKTTFYMLTSCLAIVLMFWLIEACYRNNQKKIQKRAKTHRVR